MYGIVLLRCIKGDVFMSDLLSSSAIPLYEQMKDKIKEDIDNGTLVAGSRLPTENELSEQFHVSRVTVRKALEELVSLGYIEKKSAKGTFVTEKKFTRRLSNTSGVSSFTQMCVSNNMVPGAKMIKIALEEPDEAQSKILGISPEKKMVVLERIRLANNQKVMIESNYFSEEFSFLFGINMEESLFDALKEKGIVWENSTKTIDIIFANSHESKELNVAKGYPLLRIVSVIKSSDEKYTMMSIQKCIGDKFKITV